jgi:hypothetical protein
VFNVINERMQNSPVPIELPWCTTGSSRYPVHKDASGASSRSAKGIRMDFMEA